MGMRLSFLSFGWTIALARAKELMCAFFIIVLRCWLIIFILPLRPVDTRYMKAWKAQRTSLKGFFAANYRRQRTACSFNLYVTDETKDFQAFKTHDVANNRNYCCKRKIKRRLRDTYERKDPSEIFLIKLKNPTYNLKSSFFFDL